MRKVLVMLMTAAVAAGAQQQQSSVMNPAVNAAKNNWVEVRTYLVRSADQMPESLYNFKPTPQVRSFGQIIAHVAASQNSYCAIALGEKPRSESELEKSATTKAAIVKALRESNDYCDKAYSLSDADGNAAVSLFGSPSTKLGTLINNVGHDMEHYGNLVTYFRMKGMVPPSSQGGM
ncbi:MAG TPA: DinB family protein [Gemmatimonadaceae bacterium]|nr:DinB family protein [Gemmatimonadaceae bacterium]